MPRKRADQEQERAEKEDVGELVIMDELLSQSAPDRPLTAIEVDGATRRFKNLQPVPWRPAPSHSSEWKTSARAKVPAGASRRPTHSVLESGSWSRMDQPGPMDWTGTRFAKVPVTASGGSAPAHPTAIRGSFRFRTASSRFSEAKASAAWMHKVAT